METSQSKAKRSFFISYNRADRHWAEWLAWILEEAQYTVYIQAWDFRAGENFVLKMQEAASHAERTIAVLSQNFLDSQFTQSEWAAAFAQDPTGNQRTLIPIKVGECQPKGIFAQINYIELIGLEEEIAKSLVLEALKKRGKPDRKPDFPFSTSVKKLERVTTERVQYPQVESKDKSEKMSYNLAEIRQLIRSLTNSELSDLCFDYFREVYDNTDGQPRNVRILQLLDYADRHREIPQLLAEIAKINPIAYGEYQARVGDVESPAPIAIAPDLPTVEPPPTFTP